MKFNSIFPRLLALLLVVSFFQSCKKGSEKLNERIQLIKKNPEIKGEPIHNTEIISEIYEKENDLPFEKWEEAEIDQMILAIEDISQDGLHPKDYHYSSIKNLKESIFDSDTAAVEDVAELEVLLTDAFVLMAAHLAAGKTDPEKIDPQWSAARRNLNINYESLLDSALQNGNITKSLSQLAPTHREYRNLKKALDKYKILQANGGWDKLVISASKLELGMKHEDVPKLRKRLQATQRNFVSTPKDSLFFDEQLHEQVLQFQKTNGLTADGVVGKGTVETLNIPVEERVATIKANLERWRWLNDDLGIKRVMVNIANYEMNVYEADSVIFTSKAIVGKPFRKTPVFSAKMTYMVLAPTWTVPPTILKQDVIPAVAKNQNYLKQKNMKILRSDGSEVDPSSIDWQKASSSFPYRIVQSPGKDNALGDVKFMFPNPYSVYIHDTPTKELFLQTDRSFSSGCIRINKPLEFAAFLLQDRPEWDFSRIKKAVADGKEKSISLANPLPVHILYLTAWADEEGNAYFSKDVYERDAPLLKALKQAPPTIK